MSIDKYLSIAALLAGAVLGIVAEQTFANMDHSQVVSSEGRVTYTIEGRKDPRLQATFMASYISTSKSEACSHSNPSTGTRKVKIGSKRYPITDEHYRIEIPVYLEENENECGYRFSRIELLLRRQYDNELYSRHILLSDSQKVPAIYYGSKGGFSGGGVILFFQQGSTPINGIFVSPERPNMFVGLNGILRRKHITKTIMQRCTVLCVYGMVRVKINLLSLPSTA